MNESFSTQPDLKGKQCTRGHMKINMFALFWILSQLLVALFWRQSDANHRNNAVSTYIELQIAWAMFVYNNVEL